MCQSNINGHEGYSMVTHVTFGDTFTHSYICNSIIIDMNQATFYHNKVDSLSILCIKTKLEKFYFAPGKSWKCVGYSRYMIWTNLWNSPETYWTCVKTNKNAINMTHTLSNMENKVLKLENQYRLSINKQYFQTYHTISPLKRHGSCSFSSVAWLPKSETLLRLIHTSMGRYA